MKFKKIINEAFWESNYGFISRKAYKEFKKVSSLLNQELSRYDSLIDNLENNAVTDEEKEALESSAVYKTLISKYNDSYEIIDALSNMFKEDLIKIEDNPYDNNILINSTIYSVSDLYNLLNDLKGTRSNLDKVNEKMKFKIRKNINESLSNKDKQIYIGELNKAEDREDLEDIIHEIFFYDKSLFVKLRKLPKDEPLEVSKERLVKIINDSMEESLNETSEQDNFKLYIYLNTATRERRPLQSEDLEDFIEEECSTEEEFFEAIEDLDVVDLEDIRTEEELINWLEGQDYGFGDPIIYKVIFKGATIYDESDYFESIKADLESGDYDEESSWDESLDEDTIKQGSKWVNKGKEGTHGKFTTKKKADAQRKAMFANGYKESLKSKKMNRLNKKSLKEGKLKTGYQYNANWNEEQFPYSVDYSYPGTRFHLKPAFQDKDGTSYYSIVWRVSSGEPWENLGLMTSTSTGKLWKLEDYDLEFDSSYDMFDYIKNHYFKGELYTDKVRDLIHADHAYRKEHKLDIYAESLTERYSSDIPPGAPSQYWMPGAEDANYWYNRNAIEGVFNTDQNTFRKVVNKLGYDFDKYNSLIEFIDSIDTTELIDNLFIYTQENEDKLPSSWCNLFKPIESEELPFESLKEGWVVDEYDDEFYQGEDGCYYKELSSKTVYDFDGFTTDYTLYMKVVPDGSRADVEFVTIFGDKELYKPEDGDYDFETNNYEEAKEWFDNYDTDEDIDESLEDKNDNKYSIIHTDDDWYIVNGPKGEGTYFDASTLEKCIEWCKKNDVDYIAESLTEKLIEPSKEVQDAVERLFGRYGFKIDGKGKTIMGSVHYQIRSDEVVSTQDELVEFVEPFIEDLDPIENMYDASITWNFGADKEGHITAGIDIHDQWVADENESLTVKEALNKLDVKCLDENLKYYDLRNLFEATQDRMDPQKKQELRNKLNDPNASPEDVYKILADDEENK